MITGTFKPGFNPPRGTGLIGMWLFLAALFMLFASGLLGYVIIRTRGPARGALHMPPLLWLSTALLLVVSVSIHRAVAAVARERQKQFRHGLQLTLLAGAGFLAVQTPALWQLLAAHYDSQKVGVHLYGLLFSLVLLHALHVVGGVGWLVHIARAGFHGDYDHEHYQPVRYAALYWHFLDAVWLVMFVTMLVLG